ncbi:1308_t:CDS:2, partial [Acaulospora colombiana]
EVAGVGIILCEVEDGGIELVDKTEVELSGRLDVADRLTEALVEAVPTGPDTVGGLEVVPPGVTGVELVTGGTTDDWVTPGSEAVGWVTEAVAILEIRQIKEEKGEPLVKGRRRRESEPVLLFSAVSQSTTAVEMRQTTRPSSERYCPAPP